MGFKLYREVRDFAPADWSSGELVVALMIADDARDETRQSWIPLALLCARARMSERGVRDALHRLAGRGYEFRVVHGYGKDGRPVFAAKGHAVDYAVPDLTKGGTTVPPIPVDNPTDRRNQSAAFGDPKAAPQFPKGGTNLPKGGTTVPPLSSVPLSCSSTEETSVNGGAVEGAELPTGQEQPNGRHHKRTTLELAAWQAAQSRAQRETITTPGGDTP